MATEQASFVQDSVDRFNDAYRSTTRSIDANVQRFQKQLRTRRRKLEKQFNDGRKNLEKQVESSRKTFEKQTRKQVNELRKTSFVKRAEELRKDATKEIESRVDTFLGFFNIASRSQLDRIDKKLSQLTRKLNAIERGKRMNGSSTAAHS